jgi:hypothetical protein
MDTATELKFEKVLKSSWHEEVYLTSRRDAVAAAAAFFPMLRHSSGIYSTAMDIYELYSSSNRYPSVYAGIHRWITLFIVEYWSIPMKSLVIDAV